LLGNCTLVSKGTNSAAKNRDFVEKKVKYCRDGLLVSDVSLPLHGFPPVGLSICQFKRFLKMHPRKSAGALRLLGRTSHMHV